MRSALTPSPTTPINRLTAVLAAAILALLTPLASPARAAAADTLSLQRQALSPSAELTFLRVDPAQVRVSAGVVSGGSPACFGNGAAGNNCRDYLGQIVAREGADLGLTGNYTDGHSILGTVVVGHHAFAPVNPNTTSLCVQDAGGSQAVTIVDVADPAKCASAVSGERVVKGGAVFIPGLADAGIPGRFWWSVEPGHALQRTLVGTTADGMLLLMVASATAAGARNGMTLVDAARWMVAHGAVEGIALDGGHQASIFAAAGGDQVPLERGPVRLQVALLLTRRPSPPPPPAPPPPPLPATAPAGVLPQTAPAARLPDTGAHGAVRRQPRSERPERTADDPLAYLERALGQVAGALGRAGNLIRR